MSAKIAFGLYAADGSPKTDATPVFTIYKDRDANDVTPPSIVHEGGGVYGFVAPDADVTLGIGYMITGGSGVFPSRLAGAVNLDSDPFACVLITAADDSLWTGAAPTFATYRNFSAVSQTQPTIDAIAGAYLYVFTPSAGDVSNGVNYRLAAAATSYPSHTASSFHYVTPPPASVVAPEIINISPAPGSPLTGLQAWTADASLDPGDGEIVRLIVFVQYQSLPTVEVAYDGERFTPEFNGASTIDDYVGGGYSLSIVRNGGWPDAPKLFVHATSNLGGVNE